MTNTKTGMPDERVLRTAGPARKFDLSERTAVFGEAVIRFCKIIDRTVVTTPLIGQLVRSGTSIGANYAEADGAASKKDFFHKMLICRKEAKETCYWLRMMGQAAPADEPQRHALFQEAHELTLIFSAILRKK